MYILTADGKKLLKCRSVTVEHNLGGGRAGRFCLSSPENLAVIEAYATEEEAIAALSEICEALNQGVRVYRMPEKGKSVV